MSDQCWGALVVFGLPELVGSDFSTLCALFTNGLFSPPPELSSGFFPLPWLNEIGGETFTANLRVPCSAGGTISAKIEDVDGKLSQLFIRNPSLPGWYFVGTYLSDSETTIVLSGPVAPFVDQIVWFESEALEIVAVTQLTLTSWSCEIVRGVCASFAQVHEMRPSIYWQPGSKGDREKMQVTPYPEPGRHTFLARAYRLRETAEGSTEVSHYRDGYLARSPAARINPDIYEMTFEPTGKLLEEFEVRKGVLPTPLSRCIEVSESEERYSFSGLKKVPTKILLWLTSREASLFFDGAFQKYLSTAIDSDLVDIQAEVYEGTRCHVKSTIGEGAYQIDAIEHVPVHTLPGPFAHSEFIKVSCSELKSAINLQGQESVTFPNPGGVNPMLGFTVYSGGFAEGSALPFSVSGEAPTIELRHLPSATTPEAFRAILGNGYYPPGFCIGLPDEFINWASTSPTPTLDTLDLAELNQLLTKPWLWPLKPGTKPADLFNGLCRLQRLVVTPKARGGLTLRCWNRPFLSSAPILELAQSHLEVLQDIRPLRALEFVSGVDPFTFKETSPAPRLATVQGTRTPERGDSERVWLLTNDAGAMSDDAFATGDVFACCRALFVTLQGEPIVLKGETDLDVSAIETVDFCQMTDDNVPDHTGRGVAGKRYILISIGLSWNDSGQPVLLLPDELNNADIQSVGKVAPTLRYLETRLITGAGPYTVTIRVDSLGDSTFDVTTAHGGIWQEIVDGPGYVRLLRLMHNQVNDPTQDRPGWLELYAVPTAVRFIGPESEIDLSISANWLHDDLTLEDYFVLGETFICLMDVNQNNRLGFRVEPLLNQRFDVDLPGLDFAKFDGPQPYDQHRTLIGP